MSATARSVSTAPTGAHDWVAAYEELRRSALAAEGRAWRVPGVAVVLRAGLSAWMQARRTVVGLAPIVPPAAELAGGLPGTVRTEVTVLLAEMALFAATETTS